jgi:hypothetical protein
MRIIAGLENWKSGVMDSTPETPDYRETPKRDEPGQQIGIGESLSAFPLPHHRAYGSVHGDSVG